MLVVKVPVEFAGSDSCVRVRKEDENRASNSLERRWTARMEKKEKKALADVP